MLAWVHQALASERELLLSLFGEPDADATTDIGSGGGDMPSIARLLDRVFESICKPLKARPVSAGLAACCVIKTGFGEATVHLSLADEVVHDGNTIAAFKPVGTLPCE